VVREDLATFVSLLDTLVEQVQQTRSGEKSVPALVERMNQITGQLPLRNRFDEMSDLEPPFGGFLGVPLHGDFLRKSVADVLRLGDDRFAEWLRGAEDAKRRVNALLDDRSIWFKLLPDVADTQRHAFVLLSDLP
jgi:hypothetical protein